jgi:hypothetical protein
MAKSRDAKRVPVTVEVTLPTIKDKKPDVRVYLFDSARRLVDSFPAKEQVKFEIDPKQRYQVTVGPNLPTGDKERASNLAARLASSGAISRELSPQAATDRISISLAENLVLSWLFHCINIHGTVRKLLNPGGDPLSYAPICTGTVQIFTIDLACSLARLSDAALLDIKNQTLARMFNVEVADLASFDFSDAIAVGTLAAGLFPLTGNALRNYIVNNRAALAQFMCDLIPEWAICYTQLPDAQIQPDGTFSLNYCFLFWEFPPDVYFEVVQTIDGVTKEVADPDIMCTTMWGYDGSQGAVITVTDTSAIACNPVTPGPGYLYVWPTAIGNIDLRQIDGLETLAGTGLIPGGPVGTPWGGTLPLQMQFDPNLQANNINYYRWSYRFDGDVDFTQINASVTHRWMEVTHIGPVINIHLHPVTLGPQIVGAETNLFAIPDPSLPWIDINDPADRPFAYFDSTAGQTPGRSGMVTLKLEMFDNAGNQVACANAGHGGPFTFILPDPLGGPNDYTNAPAPTIDGAGNLIFKVRVDNNPTVAQLQDVTVSGHHVDPCGMLHYASGSDTVSIQYVATQANNFIFWGLSVTRGLAGTVASTGGDVNSANPDHFNNTASKLLGSCVNAAFAVNLNTYARATNGYGRQSQYDRSATIAFALLHP